MKHESVQELFGRVAAAHPDRVAVERGPSRLTYAALDARSNRIANALLEAGAAHAEPVIILAADTAEVIASILGVLKAGCAFVPLDPSFPEGRLSLMLAQSRARWALAASAHVDKLSRVSTGAGLRVLRLDGPEVAGAAEHSPAVDYDPDQLCSIYFTSGSTGRPKAIAGRLKGIDHFARWEAEALGVGVGTRVSQLASPSFDGFLKDAFVPLCAGGVVCAPEDRGVILEAGRLVDWVDVEGIEVLHVVPSVWRSMINEGLKGKYFSELRYVVLAGEAVTPGDVGRWEEVFGGRVRLVNLYGPTETTVTKLYHFVTAEDAGRASVPIGRPMPGAAALVVNSKGRPCAPGDVGEIYIRTPYRALGYYGEPELTREAFIPNPFSNDPEDIVYKTGDYGRVLEDNNFEYLGRRDQQVKVRGVRVELGELENLLRSHSSVDDAAVIDRDDERGDKYLCAYYVPAGELRSGELREYLAGRVPEFMLPSAYIEMEELPRTLNGKLDRRALPSLEQSRVGRDAEQGAEAPRTPVEEIVCGVWAEVLRLSRVGPSDNFFELGGHSLLATRIVSRLREALSVELQLRDLFESPTAAGLAQRVEEALKAGGGQQGPPLEATPRDGELPLSYSQQRMWLLEQFSGGSSSFNIPLGMRLEGGLNIPVLEQALGEVMRRHEVLRTTFPSVGGAPTQVIGEPQPLAISVIDLRGLAEGEAEAEAKRLATEDARRPFDLARGPLVRPLLFRLSGGGHVLLCTMHHLVADAWSFDVLAAEVSSLYASFGSGRPSPLAPLRVQYADYALWQRRSLQGETLDARLDYWRRRLDGVPTELSLPMSRPRPAAPSFRGARVPVALGEELSEGLRGLSRREGTTLFMTLLGGFLGLLQQYTGEEDLVVGSVIANRERGELEGLIGFLAETLVLRVEGGGDPTWRELLGRVREACLGAYAHHVPPEALAEAGVTGRGGAAPYRVWFQFEAAARERLELGGLRWGGYKVERGGARFELSLVLEEAGKGVVGEMEYDADLFDHDTINQMVEDYTAILEEMVANPEQSV